MTENDYSTLLQKVAENFSDRTYENLMDEALDRIDDNLDKRAGSMVWNGNAPCLAEMAQIYLALDFIFTATYISTAPREYLIKRAADRSITPKEATKAVLKAKMNVKVPVGTRFSLEELNYSVIGYVENETTDEAFMHLIECETAGTDGNSFYENGQLIPIDYVDGLSAAVTAGVHTLGEDEEDTEVFRARVIESLRSIAFGGNIADYKNKALSFSGIGQVRVLPVWNGAGTVKLILMSTDVKNPTVGSTKITEIKEAIDPTENKGKGYGLAPIGHTVTVESVEEEEINVSLKIKLSSGADVDTAKAQIEKQIKKYFSSLAEKWQDGGDITVRLAYLQYLILDECKQIVDITETTISGEEERPEDEKDNPNYDVKDNKLPKLGELNIETE